MHSVTVAFGPRRMRATVTNRARLAIRKAVQIKIGGLVPLPACFHPPLISAASALMPTVPSLIDRE